MNVNYLIDAKLENGVVKFIFFNPSTNDWNVLLKKDYRPYFFISHPITQNDRENVEKLRAKTSVEEKKELLTGQTIKVTKVEMEGLSDLRSALKRFEKVWEGEVPSILSCVYDKNLTFGTQYSIEEGQVKIVSQVPEKAREKFESRFSEVKKIEPVKYDLLKRWFTLCSQPIPEIPSEGLGIEGRVNPEQHYLAVMLSRVSNIPVPMAYTSRRVSTWIKSIFHDYLRRNSILIPSSRELRCGETKRRIKGALTFPPEAGVYFNTVVVDFESLYPSLIDAYNLSHETIDCSHEKCQENKVPKLEHHVCTLRRGVYSVLIGALKDLRIHWFKPLARDKTIPPGERKLAHATSELLKLILVSSYGVTIRIHGLARPSLGESITAYGRYSLQKTWDVAREKGLHPIYGDTDSLFLNDPKEEQVDSLITTVKEHLRLDLAVDRQYSVCVLPEAMKAYFGITRNGTADIKGVTAIKSSSPFFIQNVFRDCVKEMTDVSNQTDYLEAKYRIQKVVKNAINGLKTGQVPLKHLEYQTKIHEDPFMKMRDTVLHQPYQCAIQLINLGRSVKRGDTVKFIKVKPFQYQGRTFSVKPAKQVNGFGEVNKDDYVRNLRTALNQTFKSMNIKFLEDKGMKATLADFL